MKPFADSVGGNKAPPGIAIKGRQWLDNLGRHTELAEEGEGNVAGNQAKALFPIEGNPGNRGAGDSGLLKTERDSHSQRSAADEPAFARQAGWIQVEIQSKKS